MDQNYKYPTKEFAASPWEDNYPDSPTISNTTKILYLQRRVDILEEQLNDIKKLNSRMIDTMQTLAEACLDGKLNHTQDSIKKIRSINLDKV